jgi:hypothetical protein
MHVGAAYLSQIGLLHRSAGILKLIPAATWRAETGRPRRRLLVRRRETWTRPHGQTRLHLLLLLLQQLLPELLMHARSRLGGDGGLDRPRLVARAPCARRRRREAASTTAAEAAARHKLVGLEAGSWLLCLLLLQKQHLLLELHLGIQLRLLLQLLLLLCLLLLLLLLLALQPQMETQLLCDTLPVLRRQRGLSIERGQQRRLIRVYRSSAGHAYWVLVEWRELRGVVHVRLAKLRHLRRQRLQLLLRDHLLAQLLGKRRAVQRVPRGLRGARAPAVAGPRVLRVAGGPCAWTPLRPAQRLKGVPPRLDHWRRRRQREERLFHALETADAVFCEVASSWVASVAMSRSVGPP